MKKIQALILAISLLTLAFSGAAYAAEQKKPIRVWVGEQEVTFDVPPVVANQTTYVEFKGLFKALNYTVAYDAKTKMVTGKGSHAIQINIGTGQASVDGKAAAQKLKLITQNGRILIPLRFVGESTGKLVNWNAADKTIKIMDNGPSAADLKSFQAVLDKLDAYELNADAKDIIKVIDPKSHYYDYFKNMTAQDADKPVVRTTSKLEKVADFKSNSAVILVHHVSEKVSGGFYLNNESESEITLNRGADGQWRLFDITFTDMKYIDADKVLSKEATVPAPDKEKILALIHRQEESSNKEDLDGYIATFNPESSDVALLKEQTEQLFSEYDFKFTTENITIVDYTGTAAVVYYTQTTEKLNGPQFQDNRVRAIVTVKKTSAGDWISELDGQLIDVEAIENTDTDF
ncbi:stalk domain-containing protein [Paenibacillus nasutitermitis]|uniref:Copper amine oxidase-like N-terminal domain-containing protein n=1 Tax=Paenibacillus nasutitermitis TaxID=1652958 RepID=A0A917E1X1_9BACL|nr:stalk domain-containing protein [Paenibacillus nasutitermitis]GGD96276.1 hypothetical protein GCM10010911_63710 [Paenibacillus nasutitermitis]